MMKAILFFLLGFAIAFAWIAFDPRVRIETKNKIIIAREDLPEILRDEYGLPIGTPEQCLQQN